jgi:hypothetical protein
MRALHSIAFMTWLGATTFGLAGHLQQTRSTEADLALYEESEMPARQSAREESKFSAGLRQLTLRGTLPGLE